MAKGEKLVGAMSKGPSQGAMTRVSPGVYRSAEGKLVGSKGQALPQASKQAQMIDATKLALNGVSQYGNIPQSNEPMQTLPLNMGPMSPEQRQQMMNGFQSMVGGQPPQPNPTAQVQTPGGQAYRYGNPSGIPWQDVQGGIARGSLRNMAQQARMQQPQPMPMPMPGRGYKQ
jgi:hypothetical protein